MSNNLLYDAISAKGGFLAREAKVFISGSFGLVKDGLQQTSDVLVGTIGEDFVVFFVAVRRMRVHDVIPLHTAGSA